VAVEALSKFEHDAISALSASDEQCDILLAQLARATCSSRDYTGVGLYTRLTIDPDAPRLDRTRWRIEDMPRGHAEHPDVPAGIGLILWLKDGHMSCLESYTYEGSWPEDECLIRLAT
jgi:hypothetical protein